MNNPSHDLSIIVHSNGKAENLAELLPQLHSAAGLLSIAYEILVVEHEPNENFRKIIKQNQCELLLPPTAGYGDATMVGIRHATGRYIIAMDVDGTHPAAFLGNLWEARDTADVIISSRYIPGGQTNMPGFRKIFSRLLNLVFSRGLDLPVHDMSSGFRLYKNHVVKKLEIESTNYDALQEMLVKILLEGYQIREVPFTYQSYDTAFARMVRFGLAYLRTFSRLWKLRNSIASADYDARAYNAMMPPQRYWQRQRYKHITNLLKYKGKCLDVGCGSSRIIGALPQESVALDILMRKLRYSRRFDHSVVQGSIFNLPVPAASFPCVLCSQVIEHIPRAHVLDELDRVLQPGGFLILGTPDYAKWQWLVIEWLYKVLLPQAYADEHITHYTYKELFDELVKKRGYKLETTHYILQGELILGLRKPQKVKINHL